MIIDLVMDHTSDQHPWFQAARRDARLALPRLLHLGGASRRHVDRATGRSSPARRTRVWTYDEVAGAYYYHRFYASSPT